MKRSIIAAEINGMKSPESPPESKEKNTTKQDASNHNCSPIKYYKNV